MGDADDIPMIDGVEGLTADWVSTAMARHTGGARVTSLERSPVGTGQVADTIRLDVTWDPEGAGPASLIAKVTAADETSRGAAAMTRTYEIEHAFYRDLATTLEVRSPHCYHCDHDAPGNRYVLVLEDLAPARQGDQIAGCTPDEAALAVEELVRLHAPRWGDPTLHQLPWLDRHDPDHDGSEMFGVLAEGFLDRYADALEPEIADLVRRFTPRIGAYGAHRPKPWTVAHGDYRLDNLLFGADRVAVVDWQTVSLGPAAGDLSYFMGASLLVDARRDHERDLVSLYAEAMAAAGAEGFDANAWWAEYRFHTFAGLIMAVAASMLVTRTDRGDEMFMAMAHRHGQHALDLEAERLLQ